MKIIKHLGGDVVVVLEKNYEHVSILDNTTGAGLDVEIDPDGFEIAKWPTGQPIILVHILGEDCRRINDLTGGSYGEVLFDSEKGK